MPLVRSFSLPIAGVAKRLSDAYGDGVSVVNAANDIPYRQLLLTAETADIEIGDQAVTTTAYGLKIAMAQTLPIVIGPWETGPIKLSEIWAISTTATLHILGIPF